MSDDTKQDGLDLDKFFKRYPPVGDKSARYDEINNAARFFAEIILQLVPKCADRTAAIRKIREAAWTVNFAIASDDDEGRYMKTVGYDPKTELAPIPETLKRDSWDLLASWIEGNMKEFIGTSELNSGETAMELAIRIMSKYKDGMLKSESSPKEE